MTVLAAAQSAAIRLLGRKPASLFGNDAFGLELGELATEAAVDIAEYRDWQQLKVLQVHAGDGASIAFDLPTDFSRMLKKGEVHSATWKTANFSPARDEDEWIYLQDVAISGTPGAWIILGGQMQIFPPMPVGELARYYYISKNIVAEDAAVRASTGGFLVDELGNQLIDELGNQLIAFDGALSKPAFTQDDDVFVLSERLLTLSLIWRWRAQKRMEYSEDLTNFEVALDAAATRDKGARILAVGAERGRQGFGAGASMAYPGVLGR